MLKNNITTTYIYLDAGPVVSEVYSGASGTLNGLSIYYSYDSLLRRTAVQTKNGSTVLSQNTYTYESTTGRLQKVGDGGSPEYSATYTYLLNSAMAGTVTFKQGTTTRLTTAKQYDYLHRFQSIFSAPVGTSSTDNTGLP